MIIVQFASFSWKTVSWAEIYYKSLLTDCPAFCYPSWISSAFTIKWLLLFYQVQHMRRNLDQSEAAIIQVFEEKQRVWERQMDELRQNYASRLQQVTSLYTRIQQCNNKMPMHFFFF